MPLSEKSLLDAGYYHINTTNAPSDIDRTYLSYAPDTAYLIPHNPAHQRAEEILAELTANGICAVVRGEQKNYILYRPKKDSIKISLPNVPDIQQLSFTPKKTEAATLQFGINHFRNSIGNIAIMVDDLGLPRGIADHLNMLIPESYQACLDAEGFTTPLLISERISRNRGVQAARGQKTKALKEPHKAGSSELKLEKSDSTNGRPALTSSFLENHPWALTGCTGLVGAIGLTKPDKTGEKNVPSCGIIGAGYLNEIIDAGHHGPIISVYNVADDQDIGRKLFDGAVIAAWVNPEIDLPITTILILGGNARPVTEYKRDEWTLSMLRTGIEPEKNMAL